MAVTRGGKAAASGGSEGDLASREHPTARGARSTRTRAGGAEAPSETASRSTRRSSRSNTPAIPLGESAQDAVQAQGPDPHQHRQQRPQHRSKALEVQTAVLVEEEEKSGDEYLPGGDEIEKDQAEEEDAEGEERAEEAEEIEEAKEEEEAGADSQGGNADEDEADMPLLKRRKLLAGAAAPGESAAPGPSGAAPGPSGAAPGPSGAADGGEEAPATELGQQGRKQPPAPAPSAAGGGGRARGGGRGGVGGRGRKKQQDGQEEAPPQQQDGQEEAPPQQQQQDKGDAFAPTAIPDEDYINSKVMDPMDPPPELLMSLLPYQKEWLGWSVRQEQSSVRGGILADEMGMGKTIQAISLIITHRNDDLIPAATTPALKQQQQQQRGPSGSNAPDVRPKLRLKAAAPAPAAGALHGSSSSQQQAGEGVSMGQGSGGEGSMGQGSKGEGSRGMAQSRRTSLLAVPRGEAAATAGAPDGATPAPAEEQCAAAVASGQQQQQQQGKVQAGGSGSRPEGGAASGGGAAQGGSQHGGPAAAAGAAAGPATADASAADPGGPNRAAAAAAATAGGAAAAGPAAADDAVGGAPAAYASKGGGKARAPKKKPPPKTADPMAHGDPALAAAAIRSTAEDEPVHGGGADEGAAGCSGSGCGGCGGGGGGRWCQATLVVCPMVAVIQWRGEIARYTQQGSLKVVVYHGSKRSTDPEELKSADVVLTTYSIVEGEYRRHMLPCKATCEYCKRKFYPERLKVHLRFFCGPNATKSAALARQFKKRPRGGGGSSSGATAKSKGLAASMLEREGGEGGQGGSSKGGSTSKGGGSSRGGSKRGTKGKGREGEDDDDDDMDGNYEEEVEEDDDDEEEMEGDKGLKRGKGGGRKPRAPSKARGKGGAGKGSSAAAAAAKGKGKVTDPDWEGGGDDDDGDDEDLGDGGGGGEGVSGSLPRFDEDGRELEDEAARDAARMIAAQGGRVNNRASDESVSLLHVVRWRRIILDEAHAIKDRRCSTAKAIFALSSKYKWALSGTPLQNRVGELFSQIRFLRIHPYAYYFCRKCDCQSLDYRFTKNYRQCDGCGHSPLAHFCWWNKHVANPIKNHGYVGKGRDAMSLLKNVILDKVLLRRTKVQCADVLALPPRTVVLRKDRFDERESDFYEALYTQSQAQFDAYVKAGNVVNNYAHIFELLIRLRQAVDHPYLVVHSATAQAALDAAKEGGQQQEEEEQGVCSICKDPLEDGVAAECGHTFCRTCIVEYIDGATGVARCPTCNKPLTVDLSANHGTATDGVGPPRNKQQMPSSRKRSILSRVDLRSFQSSTKMEALREELHNMVQQDASAKAIVFSQFTSMLDLLHFRLTQCGIKCVRLCGSMSMDQRDTVIEAFTHDPDVVVFLMSLKAGGVALNLTAASHVFLMDPWWNPAVEQQAQDRIHRLGQYKPIQVTRFIIRGSIEERILKLQEKKMAVFSATVGRDADALARLTEDDLKFLFQ